MRTIRWLVGAFMTVLLAAPAGAQAVPAPADETKPATIHLIGDSTVRNGNDSGGGELWGWGHFLGESVDPARFRVANHAIGGRSSRTFRSEGRWDRVVARLTPGDRVVIQFGHNDGGPLDGPKGRASLKGVGPETRSIEQGGRPAEEVHTYGWYLARYVREARAKGARPVVLSPVPRNIWTPEGKVARASRDYGRWAREVAEAEGAEFVDLNELVARRYEALGREAVGRDLFTATDHTHTTRSGAKLNASCVAEGLKASHDAAVAAAIAP